MVLAEFPLDVRHRTSLQNRDTVLGTLFAGAALGIAAQAFLLGRRRSAAGTQPGVVPVQPLLCLVGRRFCGVVRPCGNGLSSADRLRAVLPAHAMRPDRAVFTLHPGRYRGRRASLPQ
jgi:hypothetical protein